MSFVPLATANNIELARASVCRPFLCYSSMHLLVQTPYKNSVHNIMYVIANSYLFLVNLAAFITSSETLCSTWSHGNKCITMVLRALVKSHSISKWCSVSQLLLHIEHIISSTTPHLCSLSKVGSLCQHMNHRMITALLEALFRVTNLLHATFLSS